MNYAFFRLVYPTEKGNFKLNKLYIAKKYKLEYPLIEDEDGQLINIYNIKYQHLDYGWKREISFTDNEFVYCMEYLKNSGYDTLYIIPLYFDCYHHNEFFYKGSKNNITIECIYGNRNKEDIFNLYDFYVTRGESRFLGNYWSEIIIRDNERIIFERIN